MNCGAEVAHVDYEIAVSKTFCNDDMRIEAVLILESNHMGVEKIDFGKLQSSLNSMEFHEQRTVVLETVLRREGVVVVKGVDNSQDLRRNYRLRSGVSHSSRGNSRQHNNVTERHRNKRGKRGFWPSAHLNSPLRVNEEGD